MKETKHQEIKRGKKGSDSGGQVWTGRGQKGNVRVVSLTLVHHVHVRDSRTVTCEGEQQLDFETLAHKTVGGRVVMDNSWRTHEEEGGGER